MRLFALIGLALVASVTTLAPGQDTQRGHHDLSADLERWESPVRYELELRSKVEGKMMVAINSNVEFDMRIRLTRDSVSDDGSGVVSLVHERIRVDLGGDQPNTGAFDSDDPRADKDSNLGKAVTPIIDKTVTLEIDTDGRITSVRGLEALAPSDPVTRALFMTLFTEAEFKRMYQPLFAIKYEPSTAELGEEWTISTERSTGLDLAKFDHELRLERVRGAEAQVTIGGEAQVGEPGGLISTDESRIEGKAYWDTKGAQLDRFETESMLKASGVPGMDMSLKLDSATRLKRIKDDAARRPVR